MECMKQIKSIYFISLMTFITIFSGVLWMIQRDINPLNYHTIAQKSTLLTKWLYSNQYNNNNDTTTQSYISITNKLRYPHYIDDPYSDIFYNNKYMTNRTMNIEDINRVHSMWWNYELFPMKPFTECEEKYLGFGRDITFNNKNSFKILCVNNDTNDVRHSHIECYDTKFKGPSYICSFKNIYAYIDDNNNLKFKSFCKNIENEKVLDGIKRTYKSSSNNGFPLYIDLFKDDPNTTNITTVENAKYLDLNNIWFYDNDQQCESHKKGDAQHIGNPWHCLGHLEYWYRISKSKNISIHKYNTTLVMSQFQDYKFGPNVPIYHFYAPLFGNIINSDTINRVIRQNGDEDKNKLYYIKELFIDERSAKGWGAATIWQEKPNRNFFVDNACKDTQDLRRSHTYYDLRKDMMNYYELSDEYAHYNWIQEIHRIHNVNAWDIHGDLQSVVNGSNSKLVVVATRYLNGICRYRCVANMREIKDVIINTLGNQYVVIYGNPGTLTFHAQYHLFKNTRMFIGVHGAVFLMASLFMPPENLKFELTMRLGDNRGSEPNSEMVVRMFAGDTNIAYGKFYCGFCESKRKKKPSNVNVDNVINALKKTVHDVYNISL